MNTQKKENIFILIMLLISLLCIVVAVIQFMNNDSDLYLILFSFVLIALPLFGISAAATHAGLGGIHPGIFISIGAASYALCLIALPMFDGAWKGISVLFAFIFYAIASFVYKKTIFEHLSS